MTTVPEVSVVMSVHNGAKTLPATLHSVLTQDGCDYEFVVINDGSEDDTPSILDDFARRHPRMRVVHQANTGLTRALIRGCELATGEFIARQDAGDTSLPGRLAAQLAFLRAWPRAVMTACAVQFVGPRDEALYEQCRPMFDLDSGLRGATLASICGPPHHGAAMFKRDVYARVGGYRAPFVVAQDLDLWLRLVDEGQCLGMDQVFYRARLEAASISSRSRDQQVRMLEVALECRRARATGGDDTRTLAPIETAAVRTGRLTRAELARFHYFVGSCLRRRDRHAARAYYGAALRQNPLHFKALMQWILS